MGSVRSRFTRFAKTTSRATGRPAAFMLALARFSSGSRPGRCSASATRGSS